MSDAKQHHYVPQTLQKRFTDRTGGLYFFNRLVPHLGVQRSSPEKLFKKNRLYSVKSADGVRSQPFEAESGALESAVDPILEKIVAAARAGRPPGLTPAERRIWDRFFILQWRRVPDIHRRAMIYDDAEGEVRATLDEALERWPQMAAEIERLRAPRELERLTQNARVAAMGGALDPILAVLARRGLAVAQVTDPRRGFILGSLPVVKLTWPGRTDLADFGVEMWLPVAPDVLVGLGQLPDTETFMRVSDVAVIRNVNAAITRQSAIIAGRSAAQIRSLVLDAPTWAQVADGAAG